MKTGANLIADYSILIDYLHVFCVCVIHYISSCSPHQPPLLLHLLLPPISTNQIAIASIYKATQTYPQITLTPPLKPPVTIPLWTQTSSALKPSISSSRWQTILQVHRRKKKLLRGSKVNAHRLLSTIWTHGSQMKARRMTTRWYML